MLFGAAVIRPRRLPVPALLRAAVIAVIAAMAGGCRDEPPQGFHLRQLVLADRYAVGESGEPLRFSRRPAAEVLTLDQERRPVVLTTVDTWTWSGRVPERARLHVGVQAIPQAWPRIEAFAARVYLDDGREKHLLRRVRTRDRAHPRWLDFEVDLAAWAGREVTLEFLSWIKDLPPERRRSNVVAWGPVSLVAPVAPAERADPARGERTAAGARGKGDQIASGRRPNILFILVDTLRYDHLTPYGYQRQTSPAISRLLAAKGAVVEEAYAQAPWTLPSMASMLTGRYAGEVIGEDPGTFGIPPEMPVLAEELADLGYVTGGFYANPTLHEGNGFARGFETCYIPPVNLQSMLLHADSVNARAIPWLRAHADRRFFLYVHYLDPHDPYDNPEIVGGRSPFYPGYDGTITGHMVDGIYNGAIELPDPVADLRHLTALYDSEIRFVDRHVGELLRALQPEVLAETLVVLTADHGEELRDHGAWKHGQTLYEEQIHIPLILRWDARIPPGTRLRGTVRALDLVPTLIAAAGGEARPEWDGVDLLPALTGEGRLPRRPAFSRHHSHGPLRAAAILDRMKLVLFNEELPFRPPDRHQAHLWKRDLARLARVELYDLARDARERRNLAAADSAAVGRLEPLIHRQLNRELPGLRVLLQGLPAGGRLGGTIRLARPPARWRPYFLAAEDRVELDGARLTFELVGGEPDKGILLEGDIGAVEAVELLPTGAPVRVMVGEDEYGGGTVAVADLGRDGWPRSGSRPGEPGRQPALVIWIDARAGAAPPSRRQDPETVRRLKALGYLE